MVSLHAERILVHLVSLVLEKVRLPHEHDEWAPGLGAKTRGSLGGGNANGPFDVLYRLYRTELLYSYGGPSCGQPDD